MANAPARRILLWAPPRSVSTAFERSVMQHPDVSVHHELLADCYYFGSERHPKPLNPAIEESKLLRDATYASQLEALSSAEANGGKPVSFSKEISFYYQPEKLPVEVLAQYTHCFLIRKPEKVMRSLQRAGEAAMKAVPGQESLYFDADEAGFTELDSLYQVVTEQLHAKPVIVDADDLLAAPEEVLRAFYAALGLPFDEKVLSWPAGMPPQWTKWPGWHDDAAKSTGFVPHTRAAAHGAVAPPPLPDYAQKVVDAAQPIYDKLHAMRIRPATQRSAAL